MKIGAREATARHPEGFSQYEHMLTLAIAGLLAGGGVAMTFAATRALHAAVRGPVLVTARAGFALADLAALGVAVLSVMSKELLFGVTHAIGVGCKLPSIIANAYHHRSDALSSLVAIVSIGGALCGFPWVDPLGAMAVGVMVTMMGRDVSLESIAFLFGDGKKAASTSPASGTQERRPHHAG